MSAGRSLTANWDAAAKPKASAQQQQQRQANQPGTPRSRPVSIALGSSTPGASTSIGGARSLTDRFSQAQGQGQGQAQAPTSKAASSSSAENSRSSTPTPAALPLGKSRPPISFGKPAEAPAPPTASTASAQPETNGGASEAAQKPESEGEEEEEDADSEDAESEEGEEDASAEEAAGTEEEASAEEQESAEDSAEESEEAESAEEESDAEAEPEPVEQTRGAPHTSSAAAEQASPQLASAAESEEEEVEDEDEEEEQEDEEEDEGEDGDEADEEEDSEEAESESAELSAEADSEASEVDPEVPPAPPAATLAAVKPAAQPLPTAAVTAASATPLPGQAERSIASVASAAPFSTASASVPAVAAAAASLPAAAALGHSVKAAHEPDTSLSDSAEAAAAYELPSESEEEEEEEAAESDEDADTSEEEAAQSKAEDPIEAKPKQVEPVKPSEHLAQPSASAALVHPVEEQEESEDEEETGEDSFEASEEGQEVSEHDSSEETEFSEAAAPSEAGVKIHEQIPAKEEATEDDEEDEEEEQSQEDSESEAEVSGEEPAQTEPADAAESLAESDSEEEEEEEEEDEEEEEELSEAASERADSDEDVGSDAETESIGFHSLAHGSPQPPSEARFPQPAPVSSAPAVQPLAIRKSISRDNPLERAPPPESTVDHATPQGSVLGHHFAEALAAVGATPDAIEVPRSPAQDESATFAGLSSTPPPGFASSFGDEDDDASIVSHATSIASESDVSHFHFTADKPQLGGTGAIFQELPRPVPTRKTAPLPTPTVSAPRSSTPSTETLGSKPKEAAREDISATASDDEDDGSDAGTEVGEDEVFDDSEEVQQDPFALPSSDATPGPTISRLFDRDYIPTKIDYDQSRQRGASIVKQVKKKQGVAEASSANTSADISGLSNGRRNSLIQTPSPAKEKELSDRLTRKLSGLNLVAQRAVRKTETPPEEPSPEASEAHTAHGGYSTPKQNDFDLIAQSASPAASQATMTSRSSGSYSRHSLDGSSSHGSGNTQPPSRPPRHAARAQHTIVETYSPQGSVVSLLQGDGSTPEPSESHYSHNGSDEVIWKGMEISPLVPPSEFPEATAEKQVNEDEVEAIRQRDELAAWEAEIVRQTEELNKRKEEARKRTKGIMWADQVDSPGTKTTYKRTANTPADYNPMAPPAQTLSPLAPGGVPKPIISRVASPPSAMRVTSPTLALPGPSPSSMRPLSPPPAQPPPPMPPLSLEEPSTDFRPTPKSPLLLSPTISSPSPSAQRDSASKERLEAAVALLPPRSDDPRRWSRDSAMNGSGASTPVDRKASVANTLDTLTRSQPSAASAAAPESERSVSSTSASTASSGFIDYSVKRGDARRRAFAEDEEEDRDEEVLQYGMSSSEAKRLSAQPRLPYADSSGDKSLRRQSSLLGDAGALTPSRENAVDRSLDPPARMRSLSSAAGSPQVRPSLQAVDERQDQHPTETPDMRRMLSFESTAPGLDRSPSYDARKRISMDVQPQSAASPSAKLQRRASVSSAGVISPEPKQREESIRSSVASTRSMNRSDSDSIRSSKSQERVPQAATRHSKSSILASMSTATASFGARSGPSGSSVATSGSSIRSRKGANKRQSVISSVEVASPTPSSDSLPTDTASVRSRSSTTTSSRPSTFGAGPPTMPMSPREPEVTDTPELAGLPLYPARRRSSAEHSAATVETIGADPSTQLGLLERQPPAIEPGSDMLSAAEPAPEDLLESTSTVIRPRSSSLSGSRRSGRRGFTIDEDDVEASIPEENPAMTPALSSPSAEETSAQLKVWRSRRTDLEKWVPASSWDDLLITRFLATFGRVSHSSVPSLCASELTLLLFPK